jgi:hypothetical protein
MRPGWKSLTATGMGGFRGCRLGRVFGKSVGMLAFRLFDWMIIQSQHCWGLGDEA